MASVDDIGGNARGCARQYRGWSNISQILPKTRREWILFKARKIIQVLGHIYFKPILFFRVSLGYFNLQFCLSVSIFVKESYIMDILQNRFKTLAYYSEPEVYDEPIYLFQYNLWNSNILRFLAHSNRGILGAWGFFRIPWISRIQFRENALWPYHLRTKVIFRALSSIYNGAFFSKPCVTLTYLESFHIKNLSNI